MAQKMTSGKTARNCSCLQSSAVIRTQKKRRPKAPPFDLEYLTPSARLARATHYAEAEQSCAEQRHRGRLGYCGNNSDRTEARVRIALAFAENQRVGAGSKPLQRHIVAALHKGARSR